MKKIKEYIIPEQDSLEMLNILRDGVDPGYFYTLSNRINLSLDDWSSFLHLSERTLQRYKKENKHFDTIYSEKIVQIDLLYKRGADVFGSIYNFDTWMETLSVPLGGIKPKTLLDTTYGINMIADELGRIEHGVLA
jgi:putative toxin-antitoxin system antitoxin component (TIGR02293 family)